ncbi:MAG: hypothetical protein N3A66_02715 [Planctomycetota bacterium]|nr:hypothetical protein [Planctomycetota bacterium]
MDKKQIEAAQRAFCHVLESMAFLFAEPAAPHEVEDFGEECVLGSMEFSGAAAGKVWLVMPAALGPVLAANVLGFAEGNGRAASLAADAIREILNVFCGSFLPACYGDQPVFNLSVPRISRLPIAEWRAMRQARDTLAFCVDEWPVLLRISLQAAADGEAAALPAAERRGEEG